MAKARYQPPQKSAPKQPQTADSLIQEANESGSLAFASELKLRAVQLLVEDQKPERALAIFTQISPNYLSQPNIQQYILLGLNLAVERESLELAQQLLSMDSSQFDHSSVEQQAVYSDLSAKAMSLSGKHFDAAKKRVLSANLYSDDAYWENHELVWKSLRQVPSERLEMAHTPQGQDELSGWISLAIAVKRNVFNLDEQIQALTEWQAAWPHHPAAEHLPGELELLASLPSLRPERITVALPLSGKLVNAGRSVLEGFLAAYYSDSHRAVNQTKLSIIDTNNVGNIYELTEAIHTTTPDLVIGPLSKSLVSKLTNYPGYNYKTIALNYTAPEEVISESNVFQFGLSFEDELNQISEKAWLNNARRVLIFCPDNGWGQRTCRQVEQAWQEQNGIVAEVKLFNPKEQHTSLIENALKVNESKARKRELQHIIGEKLEFEPRRRKDIDAIFLIADPVNGRQIKPLLSFFFAGDLPVYTTSTIYSGKPEKTKNLDLSKVMFTETPWVIQQTNPMRETIELEWPKLANKYTRLFALGADAYLLSPRLPLLEQLPEINIPGNSGLLSLDSNQKIHRRLEWAKFSNGLAESNSGN